MGLEKRNWPKKFTVSFTLPCSRSQRWSGDALLLFWSPLWLGIPVIENSNGIEIGLQSTLHLISLVVDPVNWVEVPLDGVPGGDPPLADQEHPHAEEQDEDTRQVGVEQYLAILQEFLIPGI